MILSKRVLQNWMVQAAERKLATSMNVRWMSEGKKLRTGSNLSVFFGATLLRQGKGEGTNVLESRDEIGRRAQNDKNGRSIHRQQIGIFTTAAKVN